jgi:Protein of unknown function (DUF2510)
MPPGWYPDPPGGEGRRYWDGRAWLATPPVPGKPPKSRLKKLLIVGAVLFALLFVYGFVFGDGSDTKPSHPPSAQDLDPSHYQPISPHDYALLVKDPDAAKGRKLIVHGVVTQFDSATGTSEFRADTGAEPMESRFEYGENTYVYAPDPAILTNVVDKDMVTMYVEVAGSYSYDTQIGGSTVVPQLNVYIISVTSSG